jgi:hypothetical protein
MKLVGRSRARSDELVFLQAFIGQPCFRLVRLCLILRWILFLLLAFAYSSTLSPTGRTRAASTAETAINSLCTRRKLEVPLNASCFQQA